MGRYHGNKSVSCAKLFGNLEQEGKVTTTIEFIPPFCLNFFEDSEDYTISFEDISVTLHLDKIYLDKTNEGEMRELEKDRWGWTKKSKVRITFPDKIMSDDDERTLIIFAIPKENDLAKEEKMSIISETIREHRTEDDSVIDQFWNENIANPDLTKEERKANMEEWWKKRLETKKEMVLENGIGVLNKFIDSLRLVGGLYYLRKVSYNDIFNYKCTYHQGGVKKFEYAVDVSCKSALLIGQVEKLDLKLMEPINQLLQSDISLPVFNELLLDARSYLEDGNFRMAVIDAVSALELLVSERIYEGLKQMGYDDDLIDILMSKHWHLNERLSKLWKYIFGEAFTESNNDLWIKIGGSQNSCLNIRNKIVHKGYMPDKVESNNIILAIEEAINKINQ
jgi:hypothetical protein